MIPLIRPYITDEVKAEVLKVLDSGFLTEGAVTREFETVCRDYICCSQAIAVSNCTVGLEMALRALGIGSGDEVIVPDYTYPATASVVSIVGATPVLVDVDPATMLIRYEAIERAITSKTKAVMPVSLFGNPLEWGRLQDLKDKYQLSVIEDAACSLGAEYNDKKVGTQADISVFSLHPRKFITTGEGGLITTNNNAWAEWMRSYKHFGMEPGDTRLSASFERIGSNHKLSDVLAAIGLVQMRHITKLLEKRRRLADRYLSELSDVPGIMIPKTTENGLHSYQSCCILVEDRDQVMQDLQDKSIQTQIGTYALHMHKAFNNNPNCRIEGEMPGSRYAFKHCLTLPLYHEMTEEEQEYVIGNLNEIS